MFQFWCFKWNSEGEATPDQIAPGYPRLSDWKNSNWNDNRKRSIKEYFSSCLSLPIYSFDDYFNGESKWGFRWEFQMKKSEYKSHRGDLVAVCDGSVILNFGEKKIKIFVIKCVSSPFDDLTRWVCVIQVRHLLQELLFFFFHFIVAAVNSRLPKMSPYTLGKSMPLFPELSFSDRNDTVVNGLGENRGKIQGKKNTNQRGKKKIEKKIFNLKMLWWRNFTFPPQSFTLRLHT